MANNTKTGIPNVQESEPEAVVNRKLIHGIRMGWIKGRHLAERQYSALQRDNLRRLYKDATGGKQMQSVRYDDLQVLSKVADQAHSFMFNKEQEPE